MDTSQDCTNSTPLAQEVTTSSGDSENQTAEFIPQTELPAREYGVTEPRFLAEDDSDGRFSPEHIEVANGSTSSQKATECIHKELCVLGGEGIVIQDQKFSLPLLSPFVNIKQGQSDSPLEARMESLQGAFSLPPSSPTVSPQPSDPVNDTSPFSASVLQSPLGGFTEHTHALCGDVSLSGSASPSLFPVLGTSRPGTFGEVIGCLTPEENIVDELSSTPELISCTLEHTDTRSFPDEVKPGDKEEELLLPSLSFTEKQDICAKNDDVILAYKHDRHEPNRETSGTLAVDLAVTCALPGMTSPMATNVKPASTVSACPSTPVTVTANRQITTVIPSEQGSTSSSNSQESSYGIDGKHSSKKRSLDTEGTLQSSASKRMTIASQKRQHQKLSSPFRSPLLSKPNSGNFSTPSRTRTGTSLLSPLSLASRDTDKGDLYTPSKETETSLTAALPRNRLSKNTGYQNRPASSVKATSQFKSPLASSSTTSAHSRINTSRQIQELERKLQLLKRASKIKKDGDEEKLEQLVQKWRGVGREAAWELWQIVRDNDGSSDAPYPGTNSKSSGGSFSTGWFGSPDKRTNNGFSGQSNWGWDAPPEGGKSGDENDGDTFEPESPSKLEDTLYRSLRKKPTVVRTSMLPPTPRGAYFEQYKGETVEEGHYTGEDGPEVNGDDESLCPSVVSNKSLGTMLLQIGIAHETLGWVEDEGDFVDT